MKGKAFMCGAAALIVSSMMVFASCDNAKKSKAGGLASIAMGSEEIEAESDVDVPAVEAPANATRGDFDGDGKIDKIWIEGSYDEEGYAQGPLTLRSDNKALDGLEWNAPRGVELINLGDLDGSNRDFLGSIIVCDSDWTTYKTFANIDGRWTQVVDDFTIWLGNEDYNRVWKDTRPGYVVIAYNDMGDSFDNITRSVKLKH